MLLDTGGLTLGREVAEAHQLWLAVMREAPRMRTPFDEVWLAKLLTERGITGGAADVAHLLIAPRSGPPAVSPAVVHVEGVTMANDVAEPKG